MLSDDYNSWQETPQSEAFKDRLDTEVIVFEGTFHPPPPPHPSTKQTGYSQFKTHRRHMAKLGDWRNNAALEIPLDGIGGVSLLVRADVHRKGTPPKAPSLSLIFLISSDNMATDHPGIDFPLKPIDHQIETEGLAKLAKIAGYGVYGLPNYIVWHFDTSEKEGNLHETPVWLWPLVLCVAVVVVVVSFRYRKWILYQIPALRIFGFARSAKVRQY